MWAYVALEDGTLINFPGNAQYPDDYDARLRPWFKNTLGTWGPHWGALYPDATGTGFLLPCNYVIRSVDGDFLGVAGADLSMNHVIEEMGVPGLEHVRESLLLDAQGGVLVSSAERGLASELSMQGGKTKERRSLSAPGLERQVRSSAASGFSLEGEDLYVFARLKTVPWVLAVRLDAPAHGFTP
jgi:methyl-accepting chemotaxis protein